MPQAIASASSPSAIHARRAGRPFFGVIDSVIVQDPIDFEFDGAVSRELAAAAWSWMRRELAADLIDVEVDESDPAMQAAFDALLPELLGRARSAMTLAASSRDAEQRIRVLMGGDEQLRRLPVVLNALKCKALLDKAQSFGRAINGMQDEAALAAALQSMPLGDAGVSALLMQATIGQIANPSRLVTAAIKLAGGATELAMIRGGHAPLIDAILSHAQNQTHALIQVGPFADIDLTCRAIDRFHRLARSVNGYVELSRSGRWAMIIAALTKQVSARVEPRLRDVTLNLNMAMRRREGNDRLDSDQLLAALSGVYVLATVRDARDSLALNALFDQAWSQVGQALEIHIQRCLDLLRQNPADRITAERLDTAIKMAELRFNAEYADVLRRAKDTAEKR